jgi:glycerol-3-phosphate cytidylyltransferase
MKVGFTCSSFDLLHSGHIAMLREARSQCDYLIVGLQCNPAIDRPLVKNKPIQSIVERHIQLSAVKYVDEIIPYETELDLEDILQIFKINLRVIGEEYREKPFTGKDICKKLGIEIYHNKREHSFSTTLLRDRIKKAPAKSSLQRLIDKV